MTLGFLPELRKLRWGVDRKLLGEMLRYTWPLLLLGIVGMLNQVADKICYNHLVPGEEGRVQLGIYGACFKIAMIMGMITQAFRYAYEPFVFGGARESNSRESQAQVMKYFIIFALLAFLVVMAYLDILKYIISPGYWETHQKDLVGGCVFCHRVCGTAGRQYNICSQGGVYGLCMGQCGGIWRMRVALLFCGSKQIPRPVSA